MFIHEEAHTIVRFISCDGHKLYDFKERGVDLEVEGVRYIEMHRGRQTIRHYRARSTKERRRRRRIRRRMPNRDVLLRAVRT